jgi:hypothetical protein
MDPTRYFERWFQSYCESERSNWLHGSIKTVFKEAAYEAFNEGISFEKTKREDEDDMAND